MQALHPNRRVRRACRAGWRVILAAALACGSALLPAMATAAQPAFAYVAEPFLELREGPGRGYAVTQVVPRGEAVEVLYRRTDWYRIRTPRGIEGWASLADMRRTQLAGGAAFAATGSDFDGFRARRWEGGALGGRIGGADLVAAQVSRAFNEQVAVELNVAKYLGDTASGYLADVALVHGFEPTWRAQPYVAVGAGVIYRDPRGRPVLPGERTDQLAFVGAGVKVYWTQRFLVRAEYRSQVVFTGADENEEIDAWKIGLAFFF